MLQNVINMKVANKRGYFNMVAECFILHSTITVAHGVDQILLQGKLEGW